MKGRFTNDTLASSNFLLARSQVFTSCLIAYLSYVSSIPNSFFSSHKLTPLGSQEWVCSNASCVCDCDENIHFHASHLLSHLNSSRHKSNPSDEQRARHWICSSDIYEGIKSFGQPKEFISCLPELLVGGLFTCEREPPVNSRCEGQLVREKM